MKSALPAMLVCLLTLPASAQPSSKKKLIEFGWDEPDTAFLRAHVATMERTAPFDGCVFHAAWKPPAGAGKGGNFTWECWSARAFSEGDVSQSLADLKAAPATTMRHDFLRINVTPGDVDWFDDEPFKSVVNNAKLAAKFAHDAGCCDGVLFDIEQYDKKLFHYPSQKHASEKSWDEYAAQVRRRGAEVMNAFQQGYPDGVVMLTFGYSLPHAESEGNKSLLPKVSYGLLAPLLDGMIDAAKGKSKLVDGYERSYGYREPRQFEQAYEAMRTAVLPLVGADHQKYRQFTSFGFGLWIDDNWRKNGWNETDPSKNYFTPESFASSLSKALATADDYVWVYTETPKWWTEPDGAPSKLPEAYREALRRARGQITKE